MREAELHDTAMPARAGEPRRTENTVTTDVRTMDGAIGSAPPDAALDLAPAADPDTSAPLFPDDARNELGSRWEEIQADFVNEPRRSVEEADRLVAEATKRLADSFAEFRLELENGWKRGDDVSTEDLRRALRRYRSFFGRLVST